MKKLTTYYTNRNIIFKDIKKIMPKELDSRRKIEIYTATTLDCNYYAIFIISSKSRFIKKNAIDLIELSEKLSSYVDHNFKKKELLISSALCSKAKDFLKANSWSVKIDFM